ncbi:nuclear protein 1b [Stigmatopora argus]
MSHVDVNNLKPSNFEEQYYDQYEYYNLSDKYTEGASRKGRSKKEASENTNRPNPSGHERKIVEKLQNSEKKKLKE